VAAVAGVFDEAVPLRDGANAVAEQPAGVADLLGELLAVREPVRVGLCPHNLQLIRWRGFANVRAG
jgi:hypothetical protein